jgi:hypothetical protein
VGSKAREPQVPLDQLAGSLGREELVEVVLAAAGRHAGVERAVRLVAARASESLAPVRVEVDRGLRCRRVLG